MRKHLLISFLTVILGGSISFAQQKVKDGSVTGGNLPSSDAILELESSVKGLLHSRVKLVNTTNAAPLKSHIAGMILISQISDLMPL